MSEKPVINFVQIGMQQIPNDSGINDPGELQALFQARGIQDANGRPYVDSNNVLRFEVVSGTKG